MKYIYFITIFAFISTAQVFSEDNAPKPTSSEQQKKLVPGSTLYVVKRFQMRTKDGLLGFSEGKKVTLIREDLTEYVVTDGTNEAKASKDSFTTDPGVANNVIKAQEATRQAQIEKDAALKRQIEDAEATRIANIQRKVQSLQTAQQQIEEERQRKIDEKAKIASQPRPSRLRGDIRQVTKDGLLVFAHYGNENMPNYNAGENRPELLYGDFLVIGHPRAANKVDDDWFDVDAVPAGIYEYTTVMGATKRIRIYKVLRAFN